MTVDVVAASSVITVSPLLRVVTDAEGAFACPGFVLGKLYTKMKKSKKSMRKEVKAGIIC